MISPRRSSPALNSRLGSDLIVVPPTSVESAFAWASLVLAPAVLTPPNAASAAATGRMTIGFTFFIECPRIKNQLVIVCHLPSVETSSTRYPADRRDSTASRIPTRIANRYRRLLEIDAIGNVKSAAQRDFAAKKAIWRKLWGRNIPF